jgi:uncharacterized protein YjbI with pentapeptide repeats
MHFIVRGLRPQQLSKTVNWQFALVPAELDRMPRHLENKSVHDCVFNGVRPVDRSFYREDLHNASWRSADLEGVHFDFADLRRINLSRSVLTHATFESANIEWADFRDAKGLNRGQISRALNWNAAYFDAEVLRDLGLPPDHNETLVRLEGLLPHDDTPCAPQVPKFPSNPNVR